MKYHVRLGGLDDVILVDLEDRDGITWAAICDGDGNPGEAMPVDLAPIRNGGSFSLLLGDESLPLVASGPDDDLTLTLGSEMWQADVMDAREAAGAAVGGTGGRGAGTVRAVMPGIVREVRVAAGDEVAKDEALLILEAMKMQNEIRADHDGVVAEVHVEAGVAVAKGDLLVTFA